MGLTWLGRPWLVHTAVRLHGGVPRVPPKCAPPECLLQRGNAGTRRGTQAAVGVAQAGGRVMGPGRGGRCEVCGGLGQAEVVGHSGGRLGGRRGIQYIGESGPGGVWFRPGARRGTDSGMSIG
jgi:hypothetical protein